MFRAGTPEGERRDLVLSLAFPQFQQSGILLRISEVAVETRNVKQFTNVKPCRLQKQLQLIWRGL